MPRYINYDELHDRMYESVYHKYIENSPNRDELWNLYCAIMGEIEIQDKVTDWDDRKKLLQPRRSDYDWSLFHDIVNTTMEYVAYNARPKLEDPFGDWLSDYMWCYGIDPAETLMEGPEIEEETEG